MAYEREGIVFPMEKEGGQWGSVRVRGESDLERCCFRCETTERLISLGEDIPDVGYAISIRTEEKFQGAFSRALEDKFKHLEFKKYPSTRSSVFCPKKKYIYFGTPDSRGPQDGSIMDLIYYLY